ncbi:unnamed protein product [Cylicocyclus nassatus]|uniref:G-protein coupled receptors family 1 profile domain-containing protein n=1 Tax=Cylicocyclus nassatus TaxID=53992 RepID=A0AA36DKE0_CYLNA|nr:unnamed protein product [Cylicocyclus nassatus]
MTRKSVGRGLDLNARYQLIENIRTLKIIIPAIVLDSMLTAVDLASEYIFSVPYFVENNRCRDNTYMLKFIVIKAVHIAVEAAIPSWIFYSHPHLKRTNTSSTTIFVGRSGPVITNVFGENVGDAKQEETYETVLSRMWNPQNNMSAY